MPRVYTSRPPADRFWEKVEKGGPDECWTWTARCHPAGHGVFNSGNKVNVYAHRWAWIEVNGPVPEGLVLHHKCFNPPCVNPAHLEPVTVGENLLAGPRGPAYERSRITHCPQGHEYTPENTVRYAGSSWGRRCRECQRETARRGHARRRQQLLG